MKAKKQKCVIYVCNRFFFIEMLELLVRAQQGQRPLCRGGGVTAPMMSGLLAGGVDAGSRVAVTKRVTPQITACVLVLQLQNDNPISFFF